jgi:uncharacterized protein (DUF488 family)
VTAEVVQTIGVYGYDAGTFMAALAEGRVDLLCDVRARRGVRGADYAFANSRRLQELLAEAGVAYRHLPELAMPDDLRARQHAADRAAGVGQRSRTVLSEEVAAGYAAHLERPEAREALAGIGRSALRPCLLCVEGRPEACHRSIAAAALARGLRAPVAHLVAAGP